MTLPTKRLIGASMASIIGASLVLATWLSNPPPARADQPVTVDILLAWMLKYSN